MTPPIQQPACLNIPCWMCGNPAVTREHKFKKTDLARSSATWAPGDRPFFVGDGGRSRLRGPDSLKVKFEKVLCEYCNSTRSQPYDRAYERFSEWVNQKDSDLMDVPSLDFIEIYGHGWRDQVLHLLKYFAKHLGCRIASDGYAMPAGLAVSLQSKDLRPFTVSLTRNRNLGDLPARGPGVLGNFPMLGHITPSTGEVWGPYMYGCIVGFLDVIYRYGDIDRYAWEGDCIDPDSPITRLGEYDRASGLAHPIDALLPGDEVRRTFEIGGRKFRIPLLTPEDGQYVLSLQGPHVEKVNAQLNMVHAILSLRDPDVTKDFLLENLDIPLCQAILNCAFSGRA